jgi:hypothetical protein
MEQPETIDFSAVVYEGFDCNDVAEKFRALGFEVKVIESLGTVTGHGPVSLIEETFKTKVIFSDKAIWELSTNPTTPAGMEKSVEAVCIDRPYFLERPYLID